jgi:hypothetical protein
MRRTWLSVEDAAKTLGLSPFTIRRQFSKGVLTGHRRRQGPWNRIYIDPVSVENYRRFHLAPGQRGRARRRDGNTSHSVGKPEGSHESALTSDYTSANAYARLADVAEAEWRPFPEGVSFDLDTIQVRFDDQNRVEWRPVPEGGAK